MLCQDLINSTYDFTKLYKRSVSFYCKPLYISLRLGEPTPRRAEWIFFKKKRVLSEWSRDR